MTLSMIYFMYSLIAFVIFTIAAINIQPFKKAASRLSSTDTVFYILLSFITEDISTRGEFNTVILIPICLTTFVPIVYVSYGCPTSVRTLNWMACCITGRPVA